MFRRAIWAYRYLLPFHVAVCAWRPVPEVGIRGAQVLFWWRSWNESECGLLMLVPLSRTVLNYLHSVWLHSWFWSNNELHCWCKLSGVKCRIWTYLFLMPPLGGWGGSSFVTVLGFVILGGCHSIGKFIGESERMSLPLLVASIGVWIFPGVWGFGVGLARIRRMPGLHCRVWCKPRELLPTI